MDPNTTNTVIEDPQELNSEIHYVMKAKLSVFSN